MNRFASDDPARSAVRCPGASSSACHRLGVAGAAAGSSTAVGRQPNGRADWTVWCALSSRWKLEGEEDDDDDNEEDEEEEDDVDEEYDDKEEQDKKR